MASGADILPRSDAPAEGIEDARHARATNSQAHLRLSIVKSSSDPAADRDPLTP
jgi:hypothetical protein